MKICSSIEEVKKFAKQIDYEEKKIELSILKKLSKEQNELYNKRKYQETRKPQPFKRSK